MPQNVFPSSSPITVGVFLYLDSGLTTPAPNGKYSNGTDVFTVSGGLGEVTTAELCSSFTTTTTTSTTTTTTTDTTTTTSTTTSTTTLAVSCNNYNIVGTPSISVEWFDCGGGFNTQTVGAGGITVCAETGTVVQTGGSGNITDLGSC